MNRAWASGYLLRLLSSTLTAARMRFADLLWHRYTDPIPPLPSCFSITQMSMFSPGWSTLPPVACALEVQGCHLQGGSARLSQPVERGWCNLGVLEARSCEGFVWTVGSQGRSRCAGC